MSAIVQLKDKIHFANPSRFDAIRKAREWVKTLPERQKWPRSLKEPLSPRYPADDLLALVNPDIRKPFDMAEIVLRLVDDSRLATFKPNYGKNLLTCWAELHGQSPSRAFYDLKTHKLLRSCYRNHRQPNPRYQPRRGVKGSTIHSSLQSKVGWNTNSINRKLHHSQTK